jgi:unsaturated rhamnogalacturonyl hydrolase
MHRRQFVRGAATVSAAGLAAPLVAGTAAAAPPPSVLPSRAQVVATLRKVNDQWIGAHGSPGDNKWARATYFSGNMALHRLTGEPRYRAYAEGWAQLHQYRLNGGSGTRHADNQCAGQAYYDLYDLAPDPAKVAAINDSVRGMVFSNRRDDWWWVDALHMAMPCFARAGRFFADDRYLRKLFSLYSYTRQVVGGGLYDLTANLWYRDSRFCPPNGDRSPSGKPVFWSRGDGWAIAAHAKTLGLLSPTETRWPEYRGTLIAMAQALRTIQRADGFWNVNLGDPAHLPGPETSGTAFFVYGLAYGVRTGLLDRTTYLPVVARGWNGMVATAVHADGFLGYVQGPGYRPESSQPVTFNSTADFGVGGFLLAGTEVAALTT